MNRLDQLEKDRPVKVLTRVAGDPQIPDLWEAIEAGAFDLLDLVIPFSDPVADSPDLEAAQGRALTSGIRMDQVLDLAREVRGRTSIPLILSSYLNPLFCYGYPAFFQACQEAGVDGLLLLDLPFEEREEVLDLAKTHGVPLLVSLAPSSLPRLDAMLAQASGLVHLVGSPDPQKDRALGDAVRKKTRLATYRRP